MKHRYLLLGILVGGTMFTAAETLASSTAEPNVKAASAISIDLGREDFRQYCAACHGISGRGDGTIAEFMTITAADLTKLTKLNSGTFPRERVIHVIDGRVDVRVHGGRDMPVWGDWFDAEAVSPDTDAAARGAIVSERINALVSYIETLQER